MKPLPPDAVADVTEDRLLGQRVIYRQPRHGFRAAIDPVLLAAAIPARAGDLLLEGGSGAGAALLCVAARVAGVRGVGIERDAGLCHLARSNAMANGWSDLAFVAADIAASPVSGPVDHAFANPPYHAESGTRSPSPAREAAKRLEPDMLAVWVAALARPLRHRGTLTLILPPWLLEQTFQAMRGASINVETIFPIWPKQDRAARFLLVQGRRGGRSPLIMARGLTLHGEDGAFRPEARAILREGRPLDLRDG
jgi:tRNA1(Val) A37 N6-methylase TrmN6